MVSIEDFQKLDLRVGTVIAAERVRGTDKLVKFELDFGDAKRTVIGGWAISYPEPSELIGQQLVAVVNLEPRTIRGIESQGMLLSAIKEDQPIALQPDQAVPNGSPVR